jgi:hypothetical protein
VTDQAAGAPAWRTAGVVLSSWLGGCCWPLRAAGESLGWGFQHKAGRGRHAGGVVRTDRSEPGGLFEFGNLLPSRVASLQAKNRRSIRVRRAGHSHCVTVHRAALHGRVTQVRGRPALQALAIFGAVRLAWRFWPPAVVPVVAARCCGPALDGDLQADGIFRCLPPWCG